jgi:hypothetical protein
LCHLQLRHAFVFWHAGEWNMLVDAAETVMRHMVKMHMVSGLEMCNNI